MAAAIPVIAAFASAGAAVATAGGVAAALGTVTGFLAIGGAALTAVGAITKNAKLTKIGGFMGLASGAGQLLGIGTQAAGAGANAAAQEMANSAWSAGGAAEVAGGAGASAMETGKQALGAAVPQGMEAATQEVASQSANQLALNQASDIGGSGTMLSKPYQTALAMKDTATASPSLYALDSNPLQMRATGAGLTGADVASGTQAAAAKAGSKISPVGEWVRDNKELVGIGGSMLAAGLGAIPSFSNANALADRDKWEKSIYNRRMANLNSPIALYNKGA